VFRGLGAGLGSNQTIVDLHCQGHWLQVRLLPHDQNQFVLESPPLKRQLLTSLTASEICLKRKGFEAEGVNSGLETRCLELGL
jgi:hypothetical protein